MSNGSGSRETILARIREALQLSAPMPGQHDHGDHAHIPHKQRPATDEFSRWLPEPGPNAEAWLKLFTSNTAALRAELHLVEQPATLASKLRDIAAAEGWKKVASHRGTLVAPAAEATGLPVLWTDGGYDAMEMERCDAGITECDALVAQTGTVLLTARSGGGRALSVLPPHHVVVATRKQLVPDLPSAIRVLESKYGENYPSMMTFITGPSRTGDIERILVLGAHGPKRLSILVA